MINLIKLREPPVRRLLVFFCHSCGAKFYYPRHEDPTSSSGCCKSCGSSHWEIINPRTGERV